MARAQTDERIAVNLTEFARLLGVSSQTVHQYVKEGMPATGGGGRGKTSRIVLEEALPWVMQRLSVRDGPDSERERKAGVEADILEIKRAQILGEMFDRETMVGVFAGAITALNGSLDTLAAKHCRELAATSDVGAVRAILRDESRRVREHFAKALAELGEHCDRLARDIESRYAGTSKTASRVGKRKAKKTARKQSRA